MDKKWRNILSSTQNIKVVKDNTRNEYFFRLHKRKLTLKDLRCEEQLWNLQLQHISQGYAALALFFRCSLNICLGYKTTLVFIAHEKSNACCLKTLLNHVNFANYFWNQTFFPKIFLLKVVVIFSLKTVRIKLLI